MVYWWGPNLTFDSRFLRWAKFCNLKRGVSSFLCSAQTHPSNPWDLHKNGTLAPWGLQNRNGDGIEEEWGAMNWTGATERDGSGIEAGGWPCVVVRGRWRMGRRGWLRREGAWVGDESGSYGGMRQLEQLTRGSRGLIWWEKGFSAICTTEMFFFFCTTQVDNIRDKYTYVHCTILYYTVVVLYSIVAFYFFLL